MLWLDAGSVRVYRSIYRSLTVVLVYSQDAWLDFWCGPCYGETLLEVIGLDLIIISARFRVIN